jgi:hypothetical protein
MSARGSRWLLAFSALLLAVGAVIHTRAFTRAESAIAAAHLPPFYANSFKGLWLADSTTLSIVAAALCLIAIRPSAGSRPLVALLALVIGAITTLIYVFVGAFPAPHMLLVAAASAFAGGLLLPRPSVQRA